MENNENFVPETENVEVTTEETQKGFSQADVDRMVKEKLDEILPGKIARRESKIRKEYEQKYGHLEDLGTVLKAGTGKENVEEIAQEFRSFYESKGMKLPEKPAMSERDIQTLAKADAEEIIRSGYEEVVEEVDRLVKLGAQNMSPREKVMFQTLANHRRDTERIRELQKLGVGEEVYNSQEFKDFAGKFGPTTPIADVYGIYEKTQPKKEVRTMGSMKTVGSDDNGVKDFYSYEEAMKFTKADFDKNPALFRAVEKSMQKW